MLGGMACDRLFCCARRDFFSMVGKIVGGWLAMDGFGVSCPAKVECFPELALAPIARTARLESIGF